MSAAGMEMPKDTAVLDPRVRESLAEALLAMDVLMRHLANEYYQAGWLSNGVPNGAPPLYMTTEQLEYYEQFVDDFEDIAKVFAMTVKRVCFRTTYDPKGFC